MPRNDSVYANGMMGGRRKAMNHGVNMAGRTDSRIGGGGAATGAGVQFQTRVGALIGLSLIHI